MAVLLMAVGIGVLAASAYVKGSSATDKTDNLARVEATDAQRAAAANRHAIECVNDALGARAAVGQPDAVINGVLRRKPGTLVTDSDANRALYRALNESQKKKPTPATRRFFFNVSLHAQQVLDRNQADRAAHPVGEC